MPLFFLILIHVWDYISQVGATLAEHNTDIYPVIGFIIVTLLTVIAWGVVKLMALVEKRMDEIKGMLDDHLKSDNAYRLDVEKRFGQHHARIKVLENEAGIQSEEDEQ